MSDVTLTEFLLARIAEDEALWQMAVEADLAFVAGPGRMKAVPPTDFSRRVLAECAAKRAIVWRWQSNANHIASRVEARLPCNAVERDGRILEGPLRDLAAVYADHPDYDPAWAV